MTNLNRISIISEYQEVKEKKENLEVELYYFLASIGNREATIDELKKEIEYRKTISNYEYEMRCLEDDMKLGSAIRGGIVLLGFGILIVALALTNRCSKKEKETVYIDPIAVTTEEGQTNYYAPAGYMLAYDEDGKPYCYQEKVKTLSKNFE